MYLIILYYLLYFLLGNISMYNLFVNLINGTCLFIALSVSDFCLFVLRAYQWYLYLSYGICFEQIQYEIQILNFGNIKSTGKYEGKWILKFTNNNKVINNSLITGNLP